MQLTAKFAKQVNRKEREGINLCGSLRKTLCSLRFLILVYRGSLK